MKTRGVITGVVAGLGLLLLMGCSKPEEPKGTEGGKMPVGAPPPATVNDAMNNPNVPDSVKAQMRGMQQQGGGTRRP